VYAFGFEVRDLKISGDGSKVFCMGLNHIHAWYVLTGKAIGEVGPHTYTHINTIIDSSEVWTQTFDHGVKVWDFGVPEASSIKHYIRKQ